MRGSCRDESRQCEADVEPVEQLYYSENGISKRVLRKREEQTG